MSKWPCGLLTSQQCVLPLAPGGRGPHERERVLSFSFFRPADASHQCARPIALGGRGSHERGLRRRAEDRSDAVLRQRGA